MVEVKMGFFGDGNGNGEGRIITNDVDRVALEVSKNEIINSLAESENGIEKNRELIEKSFKDIFSTENNKSVRIFSHKKNKITPIGTHLVIGSYDIGSISRLKQMFLDKYKDENDFSLDETNEKIKSFCLENLEAVNPTVDMRSAIKAVFGEDDSMGNLHTDEPKEYEKNTTLPGAKHLGSAAAINGGSGKKNETKKLEVYITEMLSDFNKKLEKLEETDRDNIKEHFSKFLLSKEAKTVDSKKKFKEKIKPFFLDNMGDIGLSDEGIEFVELVFGDKKKDIYNEEDWNELLSDEKNKGWKENFEKAKDLIDELPGTQDEYLKDNPDHKLSPSFPFDLRIKLDEYLQIEKNRNIKLDGDQRKLWMDVLAASRNICATNPMKFFVYKGKTLGVTDKKAVDDQEVKKNAKAFNVVPADSVESGKEDEMMFDAVEKLFFEASNEVEYVEEAVAKDFDLTPFIHLDIKEYFNEVLEFTKESHDSFTDAERDGMRRVVAMAKQILLEKEKFKYLVVAGQTYKMPKKNLFSEDKKDSEAKIEDQEEKKTEVKFVAKTKLTIGGDVVKKEIIEKPKERTGEELFVGIEEKSKGVFTLELCREWNEYYINDGLGDVERRLRADIEWALNRLGEKEGKDFEKVVQYILEQLK